MERASAKPISRGAVLSPNAKQQCKMKILEQPNLDIYIQPSFKMTKGKLQTSCFQSSFAFAAWP